MEMSTFEVTPVAVDKFLGQGWPSEIQTDYGNYDECRCKIHNSVVCGLPSGKGCQVKLPGNLAPIAALYAKRGVNRACHSSVGARKLDARLAMLAMKESLADHAYLELTSGGSYKYVHSAHRLTLGQLGAGYCYMGPVRATARARVARVLGPECLASDVLRVFRVVGNCAFKKVVLTEVGEFLYHVEKDKTSKGIIPTAGADFVADLVRIISESDGRARIGAGSLGDWDEDSDSFEDGGIVHNDGGPSKPSLVSLGTPYARGQARSDAHATNATGEPRLATTGVSYARGEAGRDDVYLGNAKLNALKAWLNQEDVAWPTGLDYELGMISTAISVIPDSEADVRIRLRVFATVGLDVMSLMASSAVAACEGGEPKHVAVAKEKLSKAAFASRFDGGSLWPLLRTGGTAPGSKACRVVLDSFVGGVMHYVGFEAAQKVAKAINLGSEDVAEEIRKDRAELSDAFKKMLISSM